MKKPFLLMLAPAAIAVALSGPAAADTPVTKMDKAAHTAMHLAHQARLAKILADPSRADDAKRDKYRHPAETLEFFRVHPSDKIGEYAPGGEWVSRLLGRYVDGPGKLVGLYFNPAGFPDPKTQERIKASAAKYADDVAKVTGRPASDYSAFTLGDIPDGQKGTFNRILIMRMMHNLNGWNIADSELKAMRDLLKDDGLVGIEQHRAKADASYAISNGENGYMREADVIKMMEINGFDLVGSSEINANPKDSADWPDGVWTLPPVLAKKDVDRAKYEAIGESDRMTLLFKKRL
jgi:predicted methyltransferase